MKLFMDGFLCGAIYIVVAAWVIRKGIDWLIKREEHGAPWEDK